jgi:hypothetical protein
MIRVSGFRKTPKEYIDTSEKAEVHYIVFGVVLNNRLSSC